MTFILFYYLDNEFNIIILKFKVIEFKFLAAAETQNIGAAIVGVAHREGCDLIVTGTRTVLSINCF